MSSDHDSLQFRVSSASMLGFCIENLMFAFGDSEFGSFDDFIVLITSHLPFKESTVLYCTNLNTDPVLHLVTIGACGTFCKEAISPIENFYQLQFSRCLSPRVTISHLITFFSSSHHPSPQSPQYLGIDGSNDQTSPRNLSEVT